MTRLTENISLYSKLLLSIGQQGRGVSKRQPLPPVDCAQMIKQLMDEEKEDKMQIAERLDIGRPKEGTSIYKKRDTTQLNEFLKLLDMSVKSRDFAGWGWEGYPKIPFSAVVKVSSLPHNEQDIVLQSIYRNNKDKRDLFKRDLQKITAFRQNNPNMTIQECIEKVFNLKPITIVTHFLVCETYDKLKNFIKSNIDHKEKLLDILKNNMNGNFYEIDTTDILITISMDEEAFKTFHDQQFKKGVHFTAFLNAFLEDKIA